MPPKGYRKPVEENAVSLGELYSIGGEPRPWKAAAYATKNASRRNKTLKQVMAMERDRALGLQPGEKRPPARSTQVSREVSVATPAKPTITYMSIEAPPSLLPPKKYCDITGLPAHYTDPKSQLRYHSAEIYSMIRTFPPSTSQAFLSLRAAGAVLM